MISFLWHHLFFPIRLFKFDAIGFPDPALALESRTGMVCRISAGLYHQDGATVTMIHW
jgi:hypothetical protein